MRAWGCVLLPWVTPSLNEPNMSLLYMAPQACHTRQRAPPGPARWTEREKNELPLLHPGAGAGGQIPAAHYVPCMAVGLSQGHLAMSGDISDHCNWEDATG